jgi:hypothetical protein
VLALALVNWADSPPDITPGSFYNCFGFCPARTNDGAKRRPRAFGNGGVFRFFLNRFKAAAE